MSPSTNIHWNINQLSRRRRAVRPLLEILYAAYYGYGNEPFLGCFRDVESAIEARRKRIPNDPPKFPLTIIRPLGPAGPYRLIDDHGTWRQQLSFADPVAASLFIRALRAGGKEETTTLGADLLACGPEAIKRQ